MGARIKNKPCLNSTYQQNLNLLSDYINNPISQDEKNFNPLDLWTRSSSHISNIEKQYFIVCGTSVPCERIFSNTGNLVVSKRTNLSDRNVNILKFIKNNLRLI